jgi:hypothetical protein
MSESFFITLHFQGDSSMKVLPLLVLLLATARSQEYESEEYEESESSEESEVRRSTNKIEDKI